MSISSPRETTVRQLFALSQNQCAYPECEVPIIDPSTGTILAEVCHIHAQNEGGPRFDPSQSDEERHCFANLILLCRNHHKVIDASHNLQQFTAEKLRELKLVHETAAERSGYAPPNLSAAALKALRLTATSYESGSVHMDFRQAQFRVGGEGGYLGGGGGSGGVLTIIGLDQLPPEVEVDLNGQNGQAPGGGGGGAGALRFEGRSARSEDLSLGLRVSTLMPANSARADAVLDVLGGGWTYCPVPNVPSEISLGFACVIELGTLPPHTLLKMDVVVTDEREAIVGGTGFDLAAPSNDEPVRRRPKFVRVRCTVERYGIWRVEVRSGRLALASVPFEIRHGESIET